jgi:hypothetical protein
MMAIVRVNEQWEECWPDDAGVRIALVRRTPSIVADGEGQHDLFCVGDEAALDRLGAGDLTVVPLRDGWYQDDGEGGMAIWGQGRYWEIRDTPFSVVEAAGTASDDSTDAGGEALDIRKGIFGT